VQEIDFHRALHRPGTIVDAGAHDGRLTLPLAALPDTHVIAFEPLPPALARLRRVLEAAGIPAAGATGMVNSNADAPGLALPSAADGPAPRVLPTRLDRDPEAVPSRHDGEACHRTRSGGPAIHDDVDIAKKSRRWLARTSHDPGPTGASAPTPHRVTLRPEALSDRAGAIALSVPRVGGVAQEEWASIAKDYAAIRAEDPRVEAIDTYMVPTLPLDSLALADVTAMKIDVEGAEQQALRGALETLRRCRPILSIEIEERHRTGSTRAVPALLRPLGYRGFFEFYGDWRPIESLDIAAMQRASPSPAAFEASHPYVFTFYFVPDERLAELSNLARLA
jgi:FkbM family methyltransferase